MIQVMQIYGSCVDLFITGENLIKGPVDNVLTKNKKIIELLITDKYLEYIKNATFIQSERPIGFEGDSPIAYETDIVRIVHNNPLQEKYIIRIEERCKNLKDFLAQIKTNNNYFLLYTLNSFDINRKIHKLKQNTFITNIKYLKEAGLLDKVIFIGTVGNCWTDFWSDDLIPLIKKYNLKYFEIHDIKAWADTSKEELASLHKQFIKEINYLIQNGTNKKYLMPRNIKNKTNKQKYIGRTNAYLYF